MLVILDTLVMLEMIVSGEPIPDGPHQAQHQIVRGADRLLEPLPEPGQDKNRTMNLKTFDLRN